MKSKDYLPKREQQKAVFLYAKSPQVLGLSYTELRDFKNLLHMHFPKFNSVDSPIYKEWFHANENINNILALKQTRSANLIQWLILAVLLATLLHNIYGAYNSPENQSTERNQVQRNSELHPCQEAGQEQGPT